ncbi:MAG: DNA-binding protein [Oscillibacter sp.]|nr:DNA-binding protein [Oscillibacter sp.]
MEYRRFRDTLIVRIDKGEEILEQLRRVAEQEHIRLAEVSALGAIRDFTVGVFNTEGKRYYSNRFQGFYEIVSLTGTVSTMNGEFYAHIHMSAGNNRGAVFGGHLNSALVSATCEMVIRVIDGEVDRRFDGEIGLNLLCFPE